MLNIYRRHLEDTKGNPPVLRCLGKLKARGLSAAEIGTYRKCACPLWIIGTDPRGGYHRRSLGTTTWATAESEKQRIESGEVDRVEIVAALDAWLAALRSAKRKERTVTQVHGAMANSLRQWCSDAGYTHLDKLDTDVLDQWVNTWKYASTTHRSRIDLARSFFKFCVKRKWLTDNPASGLLKPVNDQEPTLPFTQDEEDKLFSAALRFQERPHFDGVWAKHPETARAMLYILRWTGLRASDAFAFEPRRITTQIVDGTPVNAYATYQAKTGDWVFCPIPPDVAEIIKSAPRLCDASAFLPPDSWGVATDARSVSNGFYTCYLGPLGILAGVPRVHAHRFRDTFAVRLLAAGKPLELVQTLLGHKSILTTQKHYAPWVKSRQDALIRDVASMWR